MTKILSRIIGKITSITFPKIIQASLNSFFVFLFKIDLSECNEIGTYKSLQEIFTRSLKKERIFSLQAEDIISPVDAKVVQQGTIKEHIILQVKGQEYDIKEFLGWQLSKENYRKLKNGTFINLYLSPRDYHHFHSPIDMHITNIIHIPGTLYPVKESTLKKRKVFPKNERIILACISSNNKLFYLILIGALNVGNINIFKEPRVQTNLPKHHVPMIYTYKKPLFMKKWEDIGRFNFGSSVVILSENESIIYQDNLLNKQIKFGDTIGNFIT